MDYSIEDFEEKFDAITSGQELSDPAGVARTINAYAVWFFSKKDYDLCVKALTWVHGNAPETMRLVARERLSALHFRIAQDTSTLDDPEKAIANYKLAYQMKRDVFELNRVYARAADMDQRLGRPAHLGDVLSSNARILNNLVPHAREKKSRIDPPVYRLLREALLLSNMRLTKAEINQEFIEDAIEIAQGHLSKQRYAQAENFAQRALDVHPEFAKGEAAGKLHSILSDAAIGQEKSVEAELHGKLAISYLQDRTHQTLPSEAAASVSLDESDRNVVLLFLSNIYFPLFRAWLRAYREFDHTNVVVVALDIIAFRKLKAIGVECCYIDSYQYQKDFFWGTNFSGIRTSFVHSFVNAGYNTLQSGVDSIWLKDPFQYIKSEGIEADICAMGLSSNNKNWALNLNSDILLYNSTPSTKKILPQIIDNVDRGLPDQWALNLTLSENNVEWDYGDDAQYTGHQTAKGYSRQLDLRIHLFPLSVTARSNENVTGNSVILQPAGNLGGTINELNEFFRRSGKETIADDVSKAFLR